MMRSFQDLVAEGNAVQTEGWDFSWFEGRATEQRPSWGYQRLIGERLAGVESALDLPTGGGEVLAGVPVAPPRLVATGGSQAGRVRHLGWLPAPVIHRRSVTRWLLGVVVHRF